MNRNRTARAGLSIGALPIGLPPPKAEYPVHFIEENRLGGKILHAALQAFFFIGRPHGGGNGDNDGKLNLFRG
ncbi:hypothetical protein [Paenibacillus chitinolyticus]|uniref:DUF4820 domain-containing protein n=1 Tax=Paenibacillus chitinolyticus TaxID=79263 RepID=A0ABT4FQU0_9BACL|nr:hypothetical protein [Paenibacillus chitinolyticus]MCY9593484.1 DUF4820 domain-containing protein [Paenibacillus chitinolyticus]MCY9599434.1 DUF4820 domain-containing protein [Paenibacillus chitinolyticus]